MSGRFLELVVDRKVAEAEAKPAVKVPKKFRVLLQNDDYTPMDFVVHVLTYYFHMSETLAVQVMLQVHHQGRGVCGVFTRDIAETLVNLVNDCARVNQHPLLCSMESV